MIVRLALKGREVRLLESKLTAVGYGFFIPFFFVVSGLEFNLNAFVDDPVNLLKLPLFLALFLIVGEHPRCCSTATSSSDKTGLRSRSSPPLSCRWVVAITTIAVQEGHMRSATAASLVGAAILSTTIFPILGLRLRAARS